MVSRTRCFNASATDHLTQSYTYDNVPLPATPGAAHRNAASVTPGLCGWTPLSSRTHRQLRALRPSCPSCPSRLRAPNPHPPAHLPNSPTRRMIPMDPPTPPPGFPTVTFDLTQPAGCISGWGQRMAVVAFVHSFCRRHSLKAAPQRSNRSNARLHTERTACPKKRAKALRQTLDDALKRWQRAGKSL